MIIKNLGLQDYRFTWQAMREFTDHRMPDTPDEIWLLEHPAVYTLGQAGKSEHILDAGNIPVIKTDRGGQVTYHGPGQLVAYTLFDLRRRHMNIRQLVSYLEAAVIETLKKYHITAHARPQAPGIYVDNAKIASLGLRVRRGCAYHGLALNIHMDLEPFSRINPCGYQGLAITQMQEWCASVNMQDISEQLIVSMHANKSY
jgi:lipoyl(octanoyl) transferase